jgi:predicted outer membrane protein
MEGERLGRIVAVALLSLLIPLACAAFGVSTASASGLPPSIGSASPAAQPGGGVEAPTDETFLSIVRRTGLWVIPTGQQARQRAGNADVKEIGQELADDLTTLDAEAAVIAADLGVRLPNQASEEQQGWLSELAGKSGADYDLAFANRLRGALGEVFLIAAQTRAGTWNDDVRAFASHVNDVVDRHMTSLENTGLVTDDAPPEPARTDQTTETALGPATSIPEVTPVASASTDSGGVSLGLIALICVAEAGLTAGLVLFLRSR